jgi:hypothetical protein
LWLNSPFFEWRLPDWKRPQIHLAAAAGRFFPFTKSPEALPRGYTDALLADWQFDTSLKPPGGFPVFFGWIAAVSQALVALVPLLVLVVGTLALVLVGLLAVVALVLLFSSRE